MKTNDEKCCKCGKEATIAFGGGPNALPDEWYCRECLFKSFPQYIPMFLNAEKAADQVAQGQENRVLH